MAASKSRRRQTNNKDRGNKMIDKILTIAVILQIVFIGITASKLEQDRKLIKALEKNTVSREKETQAYQTLIEILNKN